MTQLQRKFTGNAYKQLKALSVKDLVKMKSSSRDFLSNKSSRKKSPETKSQFSSTLSKMQDSSTNKINNSSSQKTEQSRQ